MSALDEAAADAMAREIAERELLSETGCALSMDERVLAVLVGHLPFSWVGQANHAWEGNGR